MTWREADASEWGREFTEEVEDTIRRMLEVSGLKQSGSVCDSRSIMVTLDDPKEDSINDQEGFRAEDRIWNGQYGK